jgi:hypothetical protein
MQRFIVVLAVAVGAMCGSAGSASAIMPYSLARYPYSACPYAGNYKPYGVYFRPGATPGPYVAPPWGWGYGHGPNVGMGVGVY